MNERKFTDELKRLVTESSLLSGFFNGKNFKRDDNSQVLENKVLITTTTQPGKAFVVWVAAEQKWLVVAAQANSVIRTTIINDRRQRRNLAPVVYPIRTLLVVDLFGYPKPPDNNEQEFYLSGNKRLKYQNSLDVVSTNTILFGTSDGFVLNKGKSYKLASKSYAADVISSYGGDVLLPYKKEYLHSQTDSVETGLYHWNSVSQLNYTNPAVQYLGNGIWQSYIEIGMAVIVNSAKDSLAGYFAGTQVIQVANQDIYGFDLITSAATDKLTAVVLPANSSTVFTDLTPTTYSGTSTVEAFIVSTQNITWGLRNKNISHTSYLPHGNDTFSYTAVRAAAGSDYTYTETIGGELLLGAFSKAYITHTAELEQITTYTSTGGSNYAQTTALTGTQTVQLYPSASETPILLETTTKFLSLQVPFSNTVLSTADYTTTFTLTTATTEFGLRYSEVATLFVEAVDYEIINPSLNLATYVGEEVLLCKVLSNKPYLIRASIIHFEYDQSTYSYTIGFTAASFTALPIVKNYPAVIPFDRIILNNGNFWNFYLSQNFANNQVNHPMIRWNGDRWGFAYGSNSTPFNLLCDQTLPFIATHPFTRFILWRKYSERTVAINSDKLLATTNLVGNTFYVVSAGDFLQEYLVGANPTNLKSLLVSEWVINPSTGTVQYQTSYTVPYGLQFPYVESGVLDASGVVVTSHSYYPQ